MTWFWLLGRGQVTHHKNHGGDIVAMQIVAQSRRSFKDFTRDEWICYSAEFLELRRGLAGASENESLVGYVSNFQPVFVRPGAKTEGESWYCWFVFPGQGRAESIVNKLMDGVYVCVQSGAVIEHDPEWTIVLGSVTRVGSEPLLTADMLRRS